MRAGGKNYRTTFLLGAGASRGALSHVLHHRKRIKAPLNGDFFKVAETYARAEGSRSPAEKRLRRVLRAFKRELPITGVPTMEQAFSLLYVAKEFPEIYVTGPGRKPDPGVRREIDDFLDLLFPILTLLDADNGGATGYDRLAQSLGDDDTLITLNYDTMLDSALHRRGWNPARGYGIGGGGRKFRWPALDLEDGHLPLRCELLKLHGSMNWFVRGSTAHLKKVFLSKPVRITQPRQNGIGHHIRQIAPPIFGKFFEHDHWRGLWRRAFDALCEAEVLVVIGCSLIDTDFHLRALLTRAVRRRKSEGNPFRHVALVDRTAVRRKWLTVLKGSFRKSIERKWFNQFLEEDLSV